MKYYIGLSNSPHDLALSIVNQSGEVLFAESQERYLQNKRAWCLSADDLFHSQQLIKEYLSDATEITLTTTWPEAFIKQFNQVEHLSTAVEHAKSEKKFTAIFQNMLASGFNERAGAMIAFRIMQLLPDCKIKVRSYEHHLCHAVYACYSSPYDKALCVIMDGFGDKTSFSTFRFDKGALEILSENGGSQASLGEYYSIVTDVAGFDPIAGEEWKVMGLAAYGKYDQEFYDMLSKMYMVDRLQLLESLDKNAIIDRLIEVGHTLVEQRKADFAYTAQYVYAEIMTELLSNLSAVYQLPNLVLGGGCALNSAYNGHIVVKTKFRSVHVPPAPSDDGNAIGAALITCQEDNPTWEFKRVASSPYLGSQIKSSSIERFKTYSKQHVQQFSEDEIINITAQAISEGKVVGWVQGRAEFGPRALGNRSILADPRDPKIKDKLNASVKFREEFRPFAPSVLEEHAANYFEHYQESPYMERTLAFKEGVKDSVPGVVHVDGTGRLQTVKRDINAKYHKLIEAFYQKTGVPILLNTSFNLMGKPIIHSLEDAIAFFYTSGLDVLVVNDYICFKG